MQAARMDDGTLLIGDVPTPEPGPDQALVRLTASGVCHSDLHLARGDWMGIPGIGPLGHEGIGVVSALGPGAERYVAEGDRVILGLGGAGGRVLVRRLRVLPRRGAPPVRPQPGAHGHLRRVHRGVRPGARGAPRHDHRPGGARSPAAGSPRTAR